MSYTPGYDEGRERGIRRSSGDKRLSVGFRTERGRSAEEVQQPVHQTAIDIRLIDLLFQRAENKGRLPSFLTPTEASRLGGRRRHGPIWRLTAQLLLRFRCLTIDEAPESVSPARGNECANDGVNRILVIAGDGQLEVSIAVQQKVTSEDFGESLLGAVRRKLIGELPDKGHAIGIVDEAETGAL